jgi:ribosome-associated translation inhibitor RaiA
MISRFYYKNFEADFDLRVSAEQLLERLEATAPLTWTVLGMLEKSGDSFAASIDIYSRFGTFAATASHEDAHKALEIVEEKICQKLSHWKQRFPESVLAQGIPVKKGVVGISA